MNFSCPTAANKQPQWQGNNSAEINEIHKRVPFSGFPGAISPVAPFFDFALPINERKLKAA